MRTMRIKLLGLLATMLLGATASFGQAVYYDANEGGVVIDCTMMPEGTILTASMESTEDEDDHQLVSHNEKADANKVYHKLVVAMADLSSGGSNTMNWDNAVTEAKGYNDDNRHTDWRLPNQCELMLIWVLRNKIVTAASGMGFTDFSFQSGEYWSSTVNSDNSNDRWYVYFDNGSTNYDGANYASYARAVREIKLP